MKLVSIQYMFLVSLFLFAFTPGAWAKPLKIVATIGQITDMAQEIGGERVKVEGLMGSGVDPHLYRASERDVFKLTDADIIFYSGLHLESKMGEVFERMSGKKTVVAVTQDIPVDQLLGDPNYPEAHDPHVWFDVTLWMMAADKIRDTLITQDPEGEELYRANAQAYNLKLQELHHYVSQRSAELPSEQRVLVTAHDAFRYFGKRYDFEVVGLQGISTETEAGTRDVMKIADFIVERKLKAIFVESSVPERNIKAVQQAVSSRGWDVVIGGELFSDALGSRGTKEGTYIGMVEHNINTIVEGLK